MQIFMFASMDENGLDMDGYHCIIFVFICLVGFEDTINMLI